MQLQQHSISFKRCVLILNKTYTMIFDQDKTCLFVKEAALKKELLKFLGVNMKSYKHNRRNESVFLNKRSCFLWIGLLRSVMD